MNQSETKYSTDRTEAKAWIANMLAEHPGAASSLHRADSATGTVFIARVIWR